MRIADDGEILIKGRGVMKGYYNNPAATAEVLKDGWLHTGDIGELDEAGLLPITDRKKDIIVTAGGKNVAPQNLENDLKTDPLISQVMVHGDKRKFLSALVTLNEETARKWASENGVAAAAALHEDPRIAPTSRRRSTRSTRSRRATRRSSGSRSCRGTSRRRRASSPRPSRSSARSSRRTTRRCSTRSTRSSAEAFPPGALARPRAVCSTYAPSRERGRPNKGVQLDQSGACLLVEDDDDNRELMAEVLAASGYEVLSAASGREGLKTLSEHSVDVVVTDVGMPGMGGLEVAKAAKAIAPACRS